MSKPDGEGTLSRAGDNVELLRVITAMAEMFAQSNRKRSTRRRKRDLTA